MSFQTGVCLEHTGQHYPTDACRDWHPAASKGAPATPLTPYGVEHLLKSIEDYRSGYSCGYSDAKSGSRMRDKDAAALFFNVQGVPDVPSSAEGGPETDKFIKSVVEEVKKAGIDYEPDHPVASVKGTGTPEPDEKCPNCEGKMALAIDIPIDEGVMLRRTKCGHLSTRWNDEKASPELEQAICEIYASRPERESPIPDGESLSARDQDIVTQDRIIEDRNRDIIDLMASLWKPFYSKDDTDGRCASCHHYAESYKEFLTEVPHHKDCKFRAVIGRHNRDASSLRGEGTEQEPTANLSTTPEMLIEHWKANWKLAMEDCAAAESREEKLKAELDLFKNAGCEWVAERGQLENQAEKLRECLRYTATMIGSVLKSSQCDIGPVDTTMLEDAKKMAEDALKP